MYGILVVFLVSFAFNITSQADELSAAVAKYPGLESLKTFDMNSPDNKVETDGELVCGEAAASESLNFSYCYWHNPESSNKDIVYVLHGLGGNEMFWFASGLHSGFLQSLDIFRRNHPRVVSVSLGADWVLNDLSRGRGLFKPFVEELIPYVESNIVGDEVASRSAIGFSMGGGNVGQLALRAPKMFENIAMICPAVFDIAIYGSDERKQREIAKYIERTGAAPEKVQGIAWLQGKYFPSYWDWRRNNPIRQAKKRLRASKFTQPLYHGKFRR